jgi:hypothetical protein
MTVLFTFLQFGINAEAVDKKVTYAHNKYIVAKRIDSLNLSFRVKVTPVVQRKINNYISFGREKTNAILGTMAMYKPLFDKFIEEKNLPEELAYLPIMESAFNPHAESHAGAKGLWQFMAPTAKQIGLSINGMVDERIDPTKSTEKALDYLQELHGMFGEWTLTLAAYNCGPGKIKGIMRSNRKARDVWDILHLLPVETQEYVPGLIAAAYVANYYDLYNLKPKALKTEEFYTSTLIVYHKVNLYETAKKLGISVSILKKLNPSYKTGIIPKSTKGNYFVLPHEKVNSYFEFCEGNVQVLITPEEILLTDNSSGFDYVVSDKSLQNIDNSFEEKEEIPEKKDKNQSSQPNNFHFVNDRMNRYIRVSREGSNESKGFASLENIHEVSIIFEESFTGKISPIMASDQLSF